MQRKLWLLALVASMLCSVRSVLADDGFYVIAGGGSVGTPITSVLYSIIQPGFYYLKGNLNYSGTDKAITVSADNVTLDLMGFSLNKSGATSSIGIYVDTRTNVEIRNGTVRGFHTGVSEAMLPGKQHRVINIRANGNIYGITINGYNTLIKGCNASNNTETGIATSSGLITDCVASYNATGISLSGPGNVLGNAAFGNSIRNFSLGVAGATAIMVDRNSAFGLNPNYYITPGTTGVVGLGSGTITNAGAP